ncbi:MAG: hypothetical protein DMD26_06795 [Gemmatimonadetes bacterium]|nr:MAG: hypothetical protein DMD26_06795 [Gemmatimonadota bacterium]
MTDIGRSRRIWRRSFFILLGVSVVVIGILLIVRPDKKVSYAGESHDTAEQNLEIVARVLQDQQPPAMRSGVLKVLRRDNPKARILATDTTVSIGNLTFLFARSGRLERVLAR